MSPPDLGLDLNLSTPKISKSSAEEDSSIEDYEQKVIEIEQQISKFEDERRKVEVFKRDLPFCMFLLNDVIDRLKAELEQCRRRKHSVIEELFMPVKSSNTKEKSSVKSKNDDCKEKIEWMSSAQLWSDNLSNCSESTGNINATKSRDGRETESLLISERKSAIVPFKEADLSLSCEAAQEQCVSLSVKSNGSNRRHVLGVGGGQVASAHEVEQGLKKARRCWSPELHRRFVAALQQLGGPQVATPKQIRELMKVDGLTNDEVKSHLQKYRLHTRRVVPNSSTVMSRSSIMVTGDLWTNNENYTKSHQSSVSPQGPFQMNSCSRAMSDSCEDDGKSESCNWK